jgi:hypothetical protein
MKEKSHFLLPKLKWHSRRGVLQPKSSSHIKTEWLHSYALMWDLCSHNSVNEDSSLMGCYAMSTDKQ